MIVTECIKGVQGAMKVCTGESGKASSGKHNLRFVLKDEGILIR